MLRSTVKTTSATQTSTNPITSNDRLVAEFFAVKRGYIQEVQAVLFNLPDSHPKGWPRDTGPGPGATD